MTRTEVIQLCKEKPIRGAALPTDDEALAVQGQHGRRKLFHQGAPVAGGVATPGVGVISIGTVITLTTVTAISIFKPWGRARWGRR